MPVSIPNCQVDVQARGSAPKPNLHAARPFNTFKLQIAISPLGRSHHSGAAARRHAMIATAAGLHGAYECAAPAFVYLTLPSGTSLLKIPASIAHLGQILFHYDCLRNFSTDNHSKILIWHAPVIIAKNMASASQALVRFDEGEVLERPIRHAWKACSPARGSWVRIPLSPPLSLTRWLSPASWTVSLCPSGG